MLSLTRKTEYALIALTYLVRKGEKSASARDIAEKFRLPLPLLMNILNELTHSGLVRSTRGARGGYRLGRTPDTITLAQVIDSTEGPLKLALCTGGDAHASAGEEEECELLDVCPIQGPVRWVHTRLERFLSEVTLAHLASGTTLVNVNVSVAGSRRPPVLDGRPQNLEQSGMSAGSAKVVAT